MWMELPENPKSHSASQVISRLIWNPKFNFRIHKTTTLNPILSLMISFPTILNPQLEDTF